jgi:tRNA U38,U39,U40 pseudouridine synthase TruA
MRANTGRIADLFSQDSDSDKVFEWIPRPGQIRAVQASRTDKVVHAISHVLSFQAIHPPNLEFSDLLRLINTQLPQSAQSRIRVLSALSVGPGFQAHQYAESCRYLYLMPVSVLRPLPLSIVCDEILPKFIGE